MNDGDESQLASAADGKPHKLIGAAEPRAHGQRAKKTKTKHIKRKHSHDSPHLGWHSRRQLAQRLAPTARPPTGDDKYFLDTAPGNMLPKEILVSLVPD